MKEEFDYGFVFLVAAAILGALVWLFGSRLFPVEKPCDAYRNTPIKDIPAWCIFGDQRVSPTPSDSFDQFREQIRQTIERERFAEAEGRGESLGRIRSSAEAKT